MTRTWVIYESMYGNTRQVAEAVAEGIGAADVFEVGAAPPMPHDVGLLVLGGPTHAFGMSRESSREEAARKSEGPVESATMGIREWLESLPAQSARPSYATFDTRVDHPHLPGSAAKKAAKRLHRLGMRQLAAPESFWVHGSEGPLADGELDRARAWGVQLAHLCGQAIAG